MQNQRDPHIDSQTINSYQQDGVVLLKGVFRPWIESLAAGECRTKRSKSGIRDQLQ